MPNKATHQERSVPMGFVAMSSCQSPNLPPNNPWLRWVLFKKGKAVSLLKSVAFYLLPPYFLLIPALFPPYSCLIPALLAFFVIFLPYSCLIPTLFLPCSCLIASLIPALFPFLFLIMTTLTTAPQENTGVGTPRLINCCTFAPSCLYKHGNEKVSSPQAAAVNREIQSNSHTHPLFFVRVHA